MINSFQFLYGPVHSWRLGRSLGIDPLASQDKVCNMNCSYCQLGRTSTLSDQRKDYVVIDDIISELKRIPNYFVDYRPT